MDIKTENKKFSDVPIRIKSWIYIILIFSIAVSKDIFMGIFVSWITYQGFQEMNRMFKWNYHFIALPFSLVQFVLLYCVSLREYIISVLFLLGLLMFYLILIKKIDIIVVFKLTIVLSLFLLGYSHLYFLRYDNEVYPIVFLVIVTELNDVFQYLTGKLFGRIKIVPKISPNKTLEGILGGIILTVFLSVCLGSLLSIARDVYILMILGFLISILGILGDLLISFLKRKAKVKDTGRLIPGHGGLMDRIDSLAFNSVFFYYAMMYL